ncbi:MAG: hypothetical protein M1840_005160 [Geoglossum simile]|nr:MAG: hypothetical protein M1840_005160 [Geoglossum simile]
MGLDLGMKVIRRVLSHEFFELTQEFLDIPGRTVEIHMMGNEMILTDEPENIRAIMSTNFVNFGKGHITHRIFGNMMRDAIFTKKVASSRPTDLKVTEEHFTQLLKHISAGGAVDVYDLIDRYQLDIVTQVYFGESANSLSTNRQPFRDAMDHLLKINTIRVIFGYAGLLISDRVLAPGSLKELGVYLDSHVTKLLGMSDSELAAKSESKDYTLLDSLGLRNLDVQGIKAQLMAVMLGGKDPSSIIIAWAIYELARNPRVVTRMRSEISSNIGFSKPPTASQLKKLPYVRNVVRETMRLYHPLGLNIKEAKSDTSLPTGGGPSGKEPVSVLAGTQVCYSIMGLQRRPDLIGPDAHLFRPDRWDTWTPNMWEFIPYNHGPRNCIGRNFGQQQCEYVLARLCQEFAQIVPSAAQVKQKIKVELNTKAAYPILCKFIRQGGPGR